jgi:ABC-type multidrug transport system ATPase subunit
MISGIMKSAIHAQSLSKIFGRTVAVDRLDLSVPEGAIYALVGANGAGKTTVIKLLMNIFRHLTKQGVANAYRCSRPPIASPASSRPSTT